MGRTGLLAIAAVLGLHATAFADSLADLDTKPDLVLPCRLVVAPPENLTPESPQGPRVPSDLEVAFDTDTGTERYVSNVSVTGSFDHAARVTIIDMSGQSMPTQTVIVEPGRSACELAASYTGVVLVSVEALDAAGHAGWPHYTSAIATPWRPMAGFDNALGSAFKWFGIALFAIISLVAVLRRIHRGTNGEVPLVISLVLAEALARHARARDGGFAILVVAAGIVTYALCGNWVVVGSVWVAVCLGDYWVASRAVSLLARPRALAELYGTNLVVRADDHTSAISLSRIEIKRGQRRALPRAAIQ